MKRIVAIVLPEIACELARAMGVHATGATSNVEPAKRQPFAVIVSSEPSICQEIEGRSVLDAVDAQAWRYGARPGQRVAEATTFVSRLRIVQLERSRIIEALGRVAEIALGFGTTASIALGSAPTSTSSTTTDHARLRYPLGAAAGPLDTVWLDITGCARLCGGEDVLCAELSERVEQLGHRARVAIAAGPRIAQAVARWKPARNLDDLIVPPGKEARWLASLPIAALPIDPRVMSWLGKLGMLRIDDLAHLDRAKLAHRLGPGAQDLLALLNGHDAVPLQPYAPAPQIVESAWLERAAKGREPLLFVLKGLVDCISARLGARGEACTTLQLDLHLDAGVVALAQRNAQGHPAAPPLSNEQQIRIALPMALHRASELLAALRARLERLDLLAPVVAVDLTVTGIGPQHRQQLDMASGRSADPHALPRLLAELGAALGPGRVGLLGTVDSYLPEARSVLVALDPRRTEMRHASADRERLVDLSTAPWPAPTRLLPQPIDLGPIKLGALVGGAPAASSATERCGPYLIDALRLSLRLDGVRWWAGSPVARDYAHGWLRSGVRSDRERPDLCEACLYVDRLNGHGFLHGWYE